MTGTWIVIVIAAGAIGCLAWPWYVKPYLMPMEGAEKLFFVVGAWVMGALFVKLSPTVVYRLPCLLIGLGLLLLGTWTAWGPIARWYSERPYWKAVELASRRENERLGREAALAERRKDRAA